MGGAEVALLATFGDQVSDLFDVQLGRYARLTFFRQGDSLSGLVFASAARPAHLLPASTHCRR